MGQPIPNYNFKSSEIRVVILGDVHWGQKHCAEDRFLKTLEFIKREKNMYCILAGDLCEFGTRSQSGSILLEQIKPPTQQILEMRQMLTPLAKMGKILGYLRDNHIERAERDAMLDMNKILSVVLGVPYLGVGGMVTVTVKKRKFRLAIQHGSDSSSNEFTALNKMLRNYPFCHVYILGHNHRLSARAISMMDVDEKGEECNRRAWQVRSGSYLKYADYARNKLFEPPVIGSPILIFNENGKINVDIQKLMWDND